MRTTGRVWSLCTTNYGKNNQRTVITRPVCSGSTLARIVSTLFESDLFLHTCIYQFFVFFLSRSFPHKVWTIICTLCNSCSTDAQLTSRFCHVVSSNLLSIVYSFNGVTKLMFYSLHLSSSCSSGLIFSPHLMLLNSLSMLVDALSSSWHVVHGPGAAMSFWGFYISSPVLAITQSLRHSDFPPLHVPRPFLPPTLPCLFAKYLPHFPSLCCPESTPFKPTRSSLSPRNSINTTSALPSIDSRKGLLSSLSKTFFIKELYMYFITSWEETWSHTPR